MKLCFSTLGCHDLSLEEIISLAKKYEIGALEIRGISGVLDNAAIDDFSEEKRAQTARILKESRISPITLGTSCTLHNAEKFDSAIAEGALSLKIAESVGFKNIRVFGNRLTDDAAAATARVISGISRLCDLSEDVNILLEVHGDFNTEKALRPITDALSDRKNFGIIWDIAHTHAPYGENWLEFYRFARPYIRHVHIKDFSDTEGALTLIGKGSIPISPIVNRLLSDGYDGYFSLEWEKKWHPELPRIEQALDGFVKIMREC